MRQPKKPRQPKQGKICDHCGKPMVSHIIEAKGGKALWVCP